MMTPKERVLVATARAQGVIMTMGALLRDMGIGATSQISDLSRGIPALQAGIALPEWQSYLANMVDEEKTGKLDEVVGNSIHALNEAAQLWDYAPEAGDGDE